MTFCSFPQYPNDLFLVVSTAQNMTLAPRSCSAAYLRTYRFTNQDHGLELVHKVRNFEQMMKEWGTHKLLDGYYWESMPKADF